MTKKEKDKTLNLQEDKKKPPLVVKTPRHISNSNQDPARLPRSQQEITVMRLSGPDTRLNLASAGMVATKGSQDVSAQLILFYTIYTNYNHKVLAKVKKLAIPWDKFKRLALRGDPKVSQEEKKKKIRCWYVYALKRED